MDQEIIFANVLYTDQLGLDNQPIADYCHKLASESDGLQISNYGGWHSEYLDPTVNELAPMFDDILERVYITAKSLGFKPTLGVKLQTSWFNLNRKHDFNVSHRHPGSIFSGVYYIKVPENSGRIVFENPIAEHSLTIGDAAVEEYNYFTADTWKIQPTEGKLIIFPSWLRHSVEPNLSEQARISLAFNCTLVHQ